MDPKFVHTKIWHDFQPRHHGNKWGKRDLESFKFSLLLRHFEK